MADQMTDQELQQKRDELARARAAYPGDIARELAFSDGFDAGVIAGRDGWVPKSELEALACYTKEWVPLSEVQKLLDALEFYTGTNFCHDGREIFELAQIIPRVVFAHDIPKHTEESVPKKMGTISCKALADFKSWREKRK